MADGSFVIVRTRLFLSAIENLLFAKLGFKNIYVDGASGEELIAPQSYIELTMSPEQAFPLLVETLQRSSSTVLLDVQWQTETTALRDSSSLGPLKMSSNVSWDGVVATR